MSSFWTEREDEWNEADVPFFWHVPRAGKETCISKKDRMDVTCYYMIIQIIWHDHFFGFGSLDRRINGESNYGDV